MRIKISPKLIVCLILILILIICLLYLTRTAQEPKRGILVERAEKTYNRYNPYYKKSVAVIIGIDDYQYETKLNNALNDSRAMDDWLDRHGFQVYTLYNSKATTRNIRRLLTDSIPNIVGKNDRLLVFYAGHGETRSLLDGGKEGFIVPVEGKAGEYWSLIPIDYFEKSSKAIQAKHQLFILDSCFSGLALDKTRSTSLSPKINNYIKELTRRKARQIIAASAENQLALDGTTGNSFFTKSLLEAIGDGMADFNADGVVTASELGMYIRYVVSLNSGQTQTPIFGTLSGHQFGDFLFFVKKINREEKEKEKLRIPHIAIDPPIVHKQESRKDIPRIPRIIIDDA